ncbi:MAG: hypothetical protein AAF483_26100 [Planctomycetota bacterium]
MDKAEYVLLVTKDLFFVPVIRGLAESLDLEILVTSKWQWQVEPGGADPIAAIVDLSAISLNDLPEIAKHLDSVTRLQAKSAFGSHVHTIRLERAQEFGFDPVLTKGQVQHSLSKALQAWSKAAESP